MDKNSRKAERMQIKSEIKELNSELKMMKKEYTKKISDAKIDAKNTSGDKKVKKVIIENQKYDVPLAIKIALKFALFFAIVESIFFIPFAWTIWFFGRQKNLYNGISIENKTKIGINALIFYGIIPGIIILSVKIKEK